MNNKHSLAPAGPIPTAPGTQTEHGTTSNFQALAITAAILILLIFSVMAFIANNQAGRQPQTITVSESQAGNRITMQIGDTLQATLEGNPTTGYNWSAEGLDSTILKSAGEPEFRPASSALGASGTVTCRFTAVSEGQTTLKLIYSRPFEKGVPPLRTFTVTVVVAGR